MLTLLGSLLGFLSAMAPDFMKMFQGNLDHKREMEFARLQAELARDAHTYRMEEVSAQADIAEAKAIYKTYQTGIDWVDALNGTVRPVLAYAFFLLYCYVKVQQFIMADHNLPWTVTGLWSVEDQAIFAGIISFYFGQRAMQKVRQGR